MKFFNTFQNEYCTQSKWWWLFGCLQPVFFEFRWNHSGGEVLPTNRRDALDIRLCIRLNNAGNYCDITLKIMVMLQNVCENYVRILEEEKHRQLCMFVILWKKWQKLASSSINQCVKSQNSAYTREYCCCGRRCAWSAININSPSFSTIEHFGDIIETNFA